MERFCCNAPLNLLLKDIKNKYLALSKQYNQNTLTLTPLLLTCVLWASSTIMSFYNPMYFILFIFTLCQIPIDKPTCLLTHLFSSWAAPSSSDCGLTFLSRQVGFRCSTLKVDFKRDNFLSQKCLNSIFVLKIQFSGHTIIGWQGLSVGTLKITPCPQTRYCC